MACVHSGTCNTLCVPCTDNKRWGRTCTYFVGGYFVGGGHARTLESSRFYRILGDIKVARDSLWHFGPRSGEPPVARETRICENESKPWRRESSEWTLCLRRIGAKLRHHASVGRLSVAWSFPHGALL